MSMTPMKRVELVVDSLHLPDALDRLRGAGVNAYTVLPQAGGMGERGEQRGDDVSGSSSNACVVIAVAPEQVDAVAEAVRPLLSAVGGMCLVSDAAWVEH